MLGESNTFQNRMQRINMETPGLIRIQVFIYAFLMVTTGFFPLCYWSNDLIVDSLLVKTRKIQQYLIFTQQCNIKNLICLALFDLTGEKAYLVPQS